MKLPREEKLKSALVAAAGTLFPIAKSPDEALGELFTDVQSQRIYGDGKTFVDLVPRRRMKQIHQEYMLAKSDPLFDLRDFVSRHFYEFGAKEEGYVSTPGMPIREHIQELWHYLERRNRRDRGSLIALPHSYIVPGGRFSEQFYWDSYFIMLGLAADGKWEMIENMMKNYAYMIRKFGFIPTANRTYFLSRSQPPFFSQMVRLLAKEKGQTRVYAEYLPYMVLEYRFWMKGKSTLKERDHKAFARVAEMPNGTLLNRYYDNKLTPRPESLLEDTTTASLAEDRQLDRLYLHLRAGAESGWDFSSRWFLDPNDIRTIHTADIIPVDLNCLLYQLENTIALSYQLLHQGNLSLKFQQAADQRARSIQEYCWNEQEQFFTDYNFHAQYSMGHATLAGVFPLYAQIATARQASMVAARLEKDFLKPGGLVTSLIENGQQWDAPNGWAPLHWIVIQGLRNYGHDRLADLIKQRWMKTNEALYLKDGKLVEKYNVVDGGQGGGGEYPLQDGFGWTNGVYEALSRE